MGIPGNLYITTSCLAFLPLDSCLSSSTFIMMYEDLEHYTKGDFMRLTHTIDSSVSDAVEIFDLKGSCITLSDFLSK
jgi:hypothetical protein